MSVVTGCNWKSPIVLPLSWKIDDSVNIINCCLNTINPVTSAPTDIVPEPFAAVKSLSVYGAVNVITLSLAKNSWFLKFATKLAAVTSVGASIRFVNRFDSVNVAGTFDPSTIAIFSVPSKLYVANLVLVAVSLDVLKKVITALSAAENVKVTLIKSTGIQGLLNTPEVKK